MLEHPLWNKGVVVQNELMFHRGDPVGALDSPPIHGLKHRSMMGFDAGDDEWFISTDGERIHTYQPETSASSSTGAPRSTPTWTRSRR